MVIRIKTGKGSKDRELPLSNYLLNELREYFKKRKDKKSQYIFPGNGKNILIHNTTIQKRFQIIKRSAGIIKDGTIHSLRHSFATHLLEGGTNILLVQRLLGHTSLRTTLKYLHVSTSYIKDFTSPLDSLISVECDKNTNDKDLQDAGK